MRRLIILIALFPAGTVYADPVNIQLNDGVFALSDNVQTEFPELWGDPTFTGTIAYDDSAVSMTNWQVNLRTGNGVEFNASGPRVQLDDDTWYMSTMAQSVAGGIDNYFLSYLWLHLNLDGTGTTSLAGITSRTEGAFRGFAARAHSPQCRNRQRSSVSSSAPVSGSCGARVTLVAAACSPGLPGLPAAPGPPALPAQVSPALMISSRA